VTHPPPVSMLEAGVLIQVGLVEGSSGRLDLPQAEILPRSLTLIPQAHGRPDGGKMLLGEMLTRSTSPQFRVVGEIVRPPGSRPTLSKVALEWLA
jgi:hypothetical protein